MRKIVVHDVDEAAMRVAVVWLSDGRVLESDVVPFPKMLLIDGVGG
jgi:hypothetical protein